MATLESRLEAATAQAFDVLAGPDMAQGRKEHAVTCDALQLRHDCLSSLLKSEHKGFHAYREGLLANKSVNSLPLARDMFMVFRSLPDLKQACVTLGEHLHNIGWVVA